MRVEFFSYSLLTARGYGLIEEEIYAKKRMRNVYGVPMTMTLIAVPVMFRADVLHVILASL